MPSSKQGGTPEGGAMDLQTFVTETLKQVCGGIQAAMDKGVRVPSDAANRVEFDVAVTAVESRGGKAGAGIFVGTFGIGGQASSQATSSSLSRIKFAVPVFYPGNPSE